MKVKIESTEYYLPEKKESNNDLLIDNPSWDISKIAEKTGIAYRSIASPSQTAVDLAYEAGIKLIYSTPSAKDIDLIVLVTQSPDYVLPTSACILQNRLGLSKKCMAFDINLGCSGFVYAMSVVSSLIESGVAKMGLILCSETYSKYINKNDRTCRPIFSDGASASLLSPSKSDDIGPFVFGTDGSGFEKLIVKKGGAREPKKNNNSPFGLLEMNGSDVFLFTLGTIPTCIKTLLEKSNLKIKDIDLFVFHQASKLVLDNIMRSMSLNKSKVFTNLEKMGNTVSATIPIALKDAESQKLIKNGDRVMLIGFGVGLSWGASIITWRKS
jgi:3-oxoacyl-[acyl-carrier-protein] synthase III